MQIQFEFQFPLSAQFCSLSENHLHDWAKSIEIPFYKSWNTPSDLNAREKNSHFHVKQRVKSEFSSVQMPSSASGKGYEEKLH